MADNNFIMLNIFEVKMAIENKYALLQEVKIIPLDYLRGRIIAIFIGRNGIEYNVRYFHEGSCKEVYFYEDELKEMS